MSSKSTWRYGLPKPLAELYINHRNADEPIQQWNTQLRLIEESLRFLTFIVMANIASSEDHCVNGIKKDLSNIVKFSFGRVYNIFKNSVDYLAKKEREIPIFCPEIMKLRHNRKWKTSVEYFKKLRNETSHDERSLTVDLAHRYLEEGEDFFIEIMNGISFLQDYHLGHFVPQIHRYGRRYRWRSARGANFDEVITVVLDRNVSYHFPIRVPIIISPTHSVLVLAPMIVLSGRSGTDDYYVWQKKDERDGQFVYFHPVRFKDSLSLRLKNLNHEGVPVECYFDKPDEWHELRINVPFTIESKDKLSGCYKINHLPKFSERTFIGSGGMGAVYKAKDEFGVFRAIKVLNSKFLGFKRERQRFRYEAKILKDLTHRNIVRVFQYGELTDEDKSPYIEMEYLEGTNLEEHLENLRHKRTVMTLEDSIEIVLQILEGLIAIHHHNITHRDLKPQNIFICENGVVKIIDFGIAKDLTTLQGHGETTKLLGTRTYSNVALLISQDPVCQIQADLYSLGLIWAYMLGHKLSANLKLNDEFKRIAPLYDRCVLKDSNPYQSAEEMKRDVLSLRIDLGREVFERGGASIGEVPRSVYSKHPSVQEAILQLSNGTYVDKELAAETLSKLAHNNVDNRTEIARLGGVKLLIELLKTGSDVGKERATDTLMKMSVDYDHSVKIYRCGGLERLIELLKSGSDVCKERAAGVLWSLTYYNVYNSIEMYRLGGIEPLMQLLLHGSVIGKENADGVLSSLAHQNTDNTNKSTGLGGIEVFINLLENGTELEKEGAATIVEKLTVNNTFNKLQMARLGGLPPLIHLLKYGSDVGKENAAAAIKNLSTFIDIRKMMVGLGVFSPVLELLKSGTDVGKEHAVTILKNLSMDSENITEIVRLGGIYHLLSLLNTDAHNSNESAIDILSNIDITADNINELFRLGGVSSLIELVKIGSVQTKEGVTEVLIKLLVEPDIISDVVRFGGLESLIELLKTGSVKGKENAAGALRKLAYNNPDNKILIVALGGIESLIQLLIHGSERGQEHAAAVLWTLSFNNQRKIVMYGGLKPLIGLLKTGSVKGKENAAGALRSLSYNNQYNQILLVRSGGIKPLIELLKNGSNHGKEHAAVMLRRLIDQKSDYEKVIVRLGGEKLLHRIKNH